MMNSRRNIPRHILIKLTKIKDKDKLYKSTKRKATNNIQGNPHMVNSRSFCRNATVQKGVTRYISPFSQENSA